MNDVLPHEPTPKTPTGFMWETLIVDPRFKDRFGRQPRRKWDLLLWTLIVGTFLVTLLVAVSLILEQISMPPPALS
jgi:hypothetical protein